MIWIRLIFLVFWLTFWLYWLGVATTSKKNVSYGSNRFIVIRLVIFILAVILLSHYRIRRSADFSQNLANNNDILLALGLLLFISGLALAIWARLHLGKNWGMPMTVKQNPQLVTSGPYRSLRHPIYTGVLSATLGTALDVSVYWLIIFSLLGAYFIYSAVTEEQNMAKQFPKVYPGYVQRTKMLIPFIF